MPKIVDKDQKRRDVALKAMDLFEKRGFERSSIREITDAAGMGKGSFYDYFKDKNELLNEIAKIIFSIWNDQFSKKIRATNIPLEQLTILVNEGAMAAASFEQFIILYIDIWRLSVGKEAFDQFHKRFRSFLIDAKRIVSSIVDKGKKDGSIRDDVDSEGISACTIAYIDGICLHYMVLKSKADIKKSASSFIDLLIRGIQR